MIITLTNIFKKMNPFDVYTLSALNIVKTTKKTNSNEYIYILQSKKKINKFIMRGVNTSYMSCQK